MDGSKCVAIMGYGTNGKKLQRVLENNGILVWGFIDNDLKKCCINNENINCKLPFEALKEYKKQFNCIIIPESYGTNKINEIVKQLKCTRGGNIENIFIALWDLILYDDEIKRQSSNELFCSYSKWRALPYLEFSVSLHCNLNCRSCTHFSPLSKTKFYDFGQFNKDITKLRKLVDRIDTIRIMGGEPLLNMQLADFIVLTRKEYPYSEIQLVTNGLLLRKMSEDLIKVLLENKVVINISFYPVIADQIREIIYFLNNNNLSYRIGNMVIEFAKVLSKTQIGNPFSPFKPVGCVCPNLFEGKLAVCPRVMFIKDLNQKFNVDYPMEGLIDLHNNGLTFGKLKELLKREIPLCSYCRSYNYEYFDICEKWEKMQDGGYIEDWQFN